MQKSGKINKNCVAIREFDLLDCTLDVKELLTKSPQPYRLNNTDVCVCVHVCDLGSIKSEIPISTFCGATPPPTTLGQ